MYHPTESALWCQCYMKGVAIAGEAGDFFGDHDSAKLVTLLTMPVTFLYLSPFTIHLTGGRRPPLHFEMMVRACRGDQWSPLRIRTTLLVGANCVRPRDGKPVPYNHFTNYSSDNAGYLPISFSFYDTFDGRSQTAPTL